jgi:hypothetical protein
MYNLIRIKKLLWAENSNTKLCFGFFLAILGIWMRCQISDNDFHKSGNACVQLGHAKNRLKSDFRDVKKRYTWTFSRILLGF